eukprot:TRINITY_DN22263_c0_g1_i2.p1 TRINITY_DN22263_c0_g1~~TRINITY_DN22263_c0_g1_i2.p1  ORF type:complete len:268 (-),score=59.78 TRINITY_DN22263_c0_g1_i2:342-1145(-)
MNYNFDTEMDLDWAADQLRRKQNMYTGLPDTPIRRITAPLKQGSAVAVISDPSVSHDTTLGNALSALKIHSHKTVHCHRLCESVLALMGERDGGISSRSALHSEFVRLEGMPTLLNVIKEHEGKTAEVALRVLAKLARTSARDICTAGGVEVLTQVLEFEGQLPIVLEVALRVLLGLSFDGESKLLLLRRGVRGQTEALMQRIALGDRTRDEDMRYGRIRDAEKEEAMAWQEVNTVAQRLAQRLADGQKGYSRRFEDSGVCRLKPLV